MKPKTVIILSFIILFAMLVSFVVAIALKDHIIAVYGWAGAATLMFALVVFSYKDENKK